MLSLSDASRYYLYRHPSDMRRSFYSLASMVREQMQGDPLSGDIFIFLSRKRNQIKLLRWERDGFAIYTKRLEQGTYELPIEAQAKTCLVTPQQLLLILEGISLREIKYRKRYPHQRVKCE